MPVYLHPGASGSHLLGALAAMLCAHPGPNPCAEELLVIKDPASEPVLSRRLADCLGATRGSDGVYAGFRIVSPTSLVAYFAAVDERDPWQPESLATTILEVLETSGDAPWRTAVVQGMYGDSTMTDVTHRLPTARRTAEIFAEYAAERPTMLRDWERLVPADGHGGHLDDDLHWQARLWAQLVERLDRSPPSTRFRELTDRARLGLASVPQRISVVGATRLCAADRAFIRALAPHREIHIFSPVASREAWEEARDSRRDTASLLRSEERSLQHVRHPVTAALGRSMWEFRRQLDELDVIVQSDLPTHEGTRPSSVLTDLQAGIWADAATVRPGPTRPVRGDSSLQLLACTGPRDQVRALGEAVTALLAEDPTLRPTDVMVLCVGLEQYLPLLMSTFGGRSARRADHPPLCLADRGDPADNPVVSLLLTLINSIDQDLGIEEVLRSFPPLLRSFWMFTDTDLQMFDAWMRQELSVGVEPANWVVGLADRWRPFIDWLLPSLAALAVAETAAMWQEALAIVIDRLSVAAALSGTVTVGRRRQAQEVVHQVSRYARADQVLDAGGLRELLVRAIEDTSASRHTDGVRVLELAPMRLLPYRVIALVGLEAGTFPRSTDVDSGNVLAQDPLTGERDARVDHRQALLEILMNAGQSVIVTYTGLNSHTGAVVAAPAPLTAVIDSVREMTGSDPVRRSWLRCSPSGTQERSPVYRTDRVTAFLRNPAQAFVRSRIDRATTDVEGEQQDALTTPRSGDLLVGSRRLSGEIDEPVWAWPWESRPVDPGGALTDWFARLCRSARPPAQDGPTTQDGPAGDLGVDEFTAREHLGTLLDLYERHGDGPVFPVRSTLAYAWTWHRARPPHRDDEAIRAARRTWADADGPAENREPAHVVLFGEDSDLQVWTPGSGPDDGAAFGELALGIWLPALEASSERAG